MQLLSISEEEKQDTTVSLRTGSIDSPALAAAGAQEGRVLKQGDEIIVQVIRDAVKTKDPVLSSNLNFTGKYSVVTLGKTQIGFSAKITDPVWKEEVKEYLLALKEETGRNGFGVIVRTNAKETTKR